jgi:hypothetical protein
MKARVKISDIIQAYKKLGFAPMARRYAFGVFKKKRLLVGWDGGTPKYQESTETTQANTCPLTTLYVAKGRTTDARIKRFNKVKQLKKEKMLFLADGLDLPCAYVEGFISALDTGRKSRVHSDAETQGQEDGLEVRKVLKDTLGLWVPDAAEEEEP